MEKLTHCETAAIKSVGIDGWEPCIFEAACNGILIRGGVPAVSKSGKKKWPARKNMQTVVVSYDDAKAEYARFELETGKCGDCYGEGKRVVGWNHIDGNKFAPCRKCKGTGKAS